MLYMSKQRAHSMKILPQMDDFLLNDDGKRLCDVTMTRLNVGWIGAASNQMCFAQLFACHLEEKKLMAFRSYSVGMSLI